MNRKDRENISNRIIKLKASLHRTDYIAIKYAEGVITMDECADVFEQRKQWRAEINALETELKALKG